MASSTARLLSSQRSAASATRIASCMAMQFGGCTDAEAYELMRDRFCAHLGSGIELWDVDDVPNGSLVP